MSPNASPPTATTPDRVTTTTPGKGSDSFVHLHVHTEYSMLDGAARIGDLFTRAAEMGMPALATTDHGYVFGAYEFWKKAQGTGVKPIIGVEAYVTPGTHRTDKTRVKWGDERTSPGDDVSGSGAYTHMTLLARDNTGLHNLFRMDSQASLDQVYAKWPRVDRELLDRYGKGLIATSGCASGEIQTRLRLGQYDGGQAGGIRLPGHLRQGELLLRGHGPRPRRRAPVHEGPHPAGARAGHAARRHQRPALHQPRGRQGALGAAVRAVRLDDDGPQPVQVRRRRLLPQEPGRDAPHLARAARGLRQHPAHRRDVRHLVHRGRGALHAPLPLPARARTRRAGSSRRCSAACASASPTASPTTRRSRPSSRPTSSSPRGMPGYFLVVADFITWAKKQRHPGRPRSWLGRRARCAPTR